MIDFDSVVLLDDSAVIKILMNLVLPESMLDVAFFNLLSPAVVKVMNLAGDFTAVLQVVPFVDLGVAAFSEKT